MDINVTHLFERAVQKVFLRVVMLLNGILNNPEIYEMCGKRVSRKLCFLIIFEQIKNFDNVLALSMTINK